LRVLDTQNGFQKSAMDRFYRGSQVRSAVKHMVGSAAALMLSLQIHAQSATSQFNLPAQSLAESLKAVAAATDVNVLFDTSEITTKRAPELKGNVTVDEALARLLAGSGLQPRHLDDKTIVLERSRVPSSSLSQSSSDGFRVAEAAQEGLANSDELETTREPVPADRSEPLQEIVVTAQKRVERLQDVPMPVTAISASSLVSNNQLQLQDYYSQVPGLTLVPGLQSAQNLTLRGVSAGVGNPTVGVLIDGIPYGSSTGLGAASAVPDIDPGDLERVEVLRGPQGTLYGASSMGGLLNFVTVDPSTAGASGRLQVGSSYIYNGAHPGYDARGSVNVPLNEELAFRASAFTREVPGYIDDPVQHIDGINEQRARGGRLAALWRPSASLSLKLSALYQEIKSDGSNDVDVLAGLGDLQQNILRGVGGYDRKAQAYSAQVAARVGSVDIASVTGYNVNSFADSFDYTSALGFYTANGVPGLVNGFGVSGTPAFERTRTGKFSQELRLATTLWDKTDWLLGAYYTHENSPFHQSVLAEDPASGAIVGSLITFDQPTTLAEYAAFTDFTFHFTDQFDLQIGGRGSRIEQTFVETDTGSFVPFFDGSSSPRFFPKEEANTNAFTYLLTPRWKPSPNLMVYVRLASGYRAGGPNQLAAGGPSKYDPDKTQDYELGLKADFFDHVLSVDSSLYYIDWKDIQLLLMNPQNGISYTVNANSAKSEGLELTVGLHPTNGMTVSAWIAWNDAELTQSVPLNSTVYGSAGDRLPFSGRFSGNVSVQEDFSLRSDVTGFVGGLVSYMSDREGPFAATASGTPQRQIFPAYARTDLHAGIKSNSWTVNFYVNNVTDRRAALQGGLDYFPTFAFVYLQPRTAGMSLVRTF